jgi:hypothetical protein
MIMLTIYHVMCFSSFVPSIDAQTYVGYSLCLMCAVHIIVNIGLIFRSTLVQTFKKWRRKYWIRWHLRQIAKKKSARDMKHVRLLRRNFLAKRRQMYDKNMEAKNAELDELIAFHLEREKTFQTILREQRSETLNKSQRFADNNLL